MDLLREATFHAPSVITDRISAANYWRKYSRKYAHATELEAAKQTINLLDLAVSQSASLEGLSDLLMREDSFEDAQGIASDAAALALQAGDAKLAVSLLEQGRSTIFTQLGRYRSVIEEVGIVSPTLAERFVRLSTELDNLVVGKVAGGSKAEARTGSFEDAADRYGILRRIRHGC